MTDTIEKRKMNKTICPKCSREIYRLGYASHMEKHHREERELNKPKYSQIEVNKLLSQAREEERERIKKTLEENYGFDKETRNIFFDMIDSLASEKEEI